jgi:hypothetical protein
MAREEYIVGNEGVSTGVVTIALVSTGEEL